MPVVAHDFQGAFAVDPLFQPPQSFVDGLAFFKFNFGQNTLTSSPETLDHRANTAGAPLCQAQKTSGQVVIVNWKPNPKTWVTWVFLAMAQQ